MGKIRKILGIIVIMALLLSSSAPFVTQLATAAEGEGGTATKAEPIEEVEPEESTSGELDGLSVKPAHMVLEDVVCKSSA